MIFSPSAEARALLDTGGASSDATGAVGGYPVENCARIMMQQIVDYTFEPLKTLREIIICVDSETALEPFEREFQRQLEDLTDTGSTGKVPVL